MDAAAVWASFSRSVPMASVLWPMTFRIRNPKRPDIAAKPTATPSVT